MREILSKKDLRLLQIIDCLISMRKTTFEEVQRNTLIKQRTLWTDVNMLKDLCRPVEIISSSKGIELFIPKNYNEKYIYRRLLEHSTEFQVLEYLLFHSVDNIQQLCDHFYTTPPITRKIIRHINRTLHKFQLEINLKDFMIYGNMENQASLYFTLFQEKYSDIGELMSFDEITTISTFIDNIPLLNKEISNNQQRKRWILWIYTRSMIFKRYSSLIEYNQVSPMEVENWDDIVNLFEISFNWELNAKFLYYCFGTFFADHTLAENFSKKLITFGTNDEGGLVDGIFRFFSMFVDEFKIELSDIDQLAIEQVNLLRLKEVPYYVLYDYYKHFVNQVREYEENLIERLEGIFEKSFGNRYIIYKYAFLYNIFVHWEDVFKIIMEKRVINVGIFFDSDYNHSLMLKAVLEDEFQSYVKFIPFDVFDNNQLSIQLQRKDCNILITNISGLELKHCVTVCVSEFMFEDEWTNLRGAIHKVKYNQI